MTVQVTGCRLLVRPFELEEVDETVRKAKQLGIILDQDERKAKAQCEKGELLQIGPKASNEYIEGAKVGDVIGFAKFGGKFVKDGDLELLIINDEDLICIFKDE